MGVDGVLKGVGLEFLRPAMARRRAVELPKVLQGFAQVAVRPGEIGFDLQRPAVACHRSVKLPEVLQGVAQVVVRIGESGLISSARR